MTRTPVYDAMLADLVSRARAGDLAAAPLQAAVALHEAGPAGTCRGCGLPAPCPTATLLDGSSDLDDARSEARRLLADRAVENTSDPAPDDAAERPTPVLPSAAELFAPNPGTARALDALLGGPPRR